MEAAAWMTAIAADAGVILTASPLFAFTATLVLAAAWCIRIDGAEGDVQLLEPSTLNL